MIEPAITRLSIPHLVFAQPPPSQSSGVDILGLGASGNRASARAHTTQRADSNAEAQSCQRRLGAKLNARRIRVALRFPETMSGSDPSRGN